MAPIRESYELPDGEISGLHFNAEAGPIRLVFLHANGFNAQSYSALLSALDVHAVALDMRGHGFSNLPTNIEEIDSFQIFANDLVEFMGRYITGKVILAGHSLGATCGILASQQLQDRLAGYLGLDPVTVPSLIGNIARLKFGRTLLKKFVPLAKNSGKRRCLFESQQQVFDWYKGRGVFKGMPDETLNDYLSGGLRSHSAGVELCCDPLWEQAIYCAQVNDIFSGAQHLPENAEIHYAGNQSVSTKSTRGKISKVLGEDKVVFHPEYYHMFPLQEAKSTLGLLSAWIERVAW